MRSTVKTVKKKKQKRREFKAGYLVMKLQTSVYVKDISGQEFQSEISDSFAGMIPVVTSLKQAKLLAEKGKYRIMKIEQGERLNAT